MNDDKQRYRQIVQKKNVPYSYNFSKRERVRTLDLMILKMGIETPISNQPQAYKREPPGPEVGQQRGRTVEPQTVAGGKWI